MLSARPTTRASYGRKPQKQPRDLGAHHWRSLTRRQSGNCGMMHPVGLRDCPAALTSLEPLDGFPLLVVVELGGSAELCAALDGGDTALVGALEDAMALFLGQAGE